VLAFIVGQVSLDQLRLHCCINLPVPTPFDLNDNRNAIVEPILFVGPDSIHVNIGPLALVYLKLRKAAAFALRPSGPFKLPPGNTVAVPVSVPFQPGCLRAARCVSTGPTAGSLASKFKGPSRVAERQRSLGVQVQHAVLLVKRRGGSS